MQVGALREVSNKAHNAELKLFLEVEYGPVCFNHIWDNLNIGNIEGEQIEDFLRFLL